MSAAGHQSFVTDGSDSPDFYPQEFGDLIPAGRGLSAGANEMTLTLPLRRRSLLTNPVLQSGSDSLYSDGGPALDRYD